MATIQDILAILAAMQGSTMLLALTLLAAILALLLVLKIIKKTKSCPIHHHA